ncbi:MAG: hypothetical protein H6606_08050 [Flavobacteriales bacterium]|nr:hypothetical protein [Flavobacteriales bacterium]
MTILTIATTATSSFARHDTLFVDIPGRISGHVFYNGNLWICTSGLDVFEYDTSNRKLERHNTGLLTEGFGDGFLVHKDDLYLLQQHKVKKFILEGNYWKDVSPDISKLPEPRTEYMFSCLGGNDEILLVGSLSTSFGFESEADALLFYSIDGGISWNEVLPEFKKTDLQCFYNTGKGWIIGCGNSTLLFLDTGLQNIAEIPFAKSYKTWTGFQAVDAFKDTIFAVNDSEGVYASTDAITWHPYMKHRHTVALALGYEGVLLGYSNAGGIRTFSPGKLGYLACTFPGSENEDVLFYSKRGSLKIYGTRTQMALVHE